MLESVGAAAWENQGPVEKDNMSGLPPADWPERESAGVAAARYTDQRRQKWLAVA
jgi:hypothetical protein